MKTNDLIKNLASTAKSIEPLKKPSHWILQLVLFSLFYYVAIQIFIGFRSDLSQKIIQPFFVAEIVLILLLILSCLVSATLMIYPDAYQKPYFLKTPYLILLMLIGLFISEFFWQDPNELVALSTHEIECAICIAAFAIMPSLYFFFIFRKGANIDPLKSGIFAVIAASALSALALRLQEQQDILAHLLIWHYLPIVVFSLIGAFAGRFAFKW